MVFALQGLALRYRCICHYNFHLKVALWELLLAHGLPRPEWKVFSDLGFMFEHHWSHYRRHQVDAPRLARHWERAHQRSLLFPAPLGPTCWNNSFPGCTQVPLLQVQARIGKWGGTWEKEKYWGGGLGKIPQSFHDIEMFIMGKSSGKKQNPAPGGIYHWLVLYCPFWLWQPINGWVMKGCGFLRQEDDKFSFLSRCSEGLRNLEKVFLERTQTKQSGTENPPDGGRKVMWSE